MNIAQKLSAVTIKMGAYMSVKLMSLAFELPIVATSLALLDLPPLPSDTDNNGTLRIGFSSDAAGWNGAVLYRSDDGGEAGGNNFNSILGSDTQAIIGTVLNLVGVGVTQYFDRINFIDIALVLGSLSSKSELAILNGANACVVGDEIIQFTTATLAAPNRYRLEGLLRGRLGTEHLVDSHSIGEQFALLDSGVIKESLPLTLLGITSYYKAVSIGATLAATDEISFKYQGRKFLPFSPVHIKGVRDGSDNLTISWIRRTRLGGQCSDFADVPLMEERELYQIDIMNGTNVVRTITATNQNCVYSAAEQITDFGSTQPIINIKIYQISAIIGRGTAGLATI